MPKVREACTSKTVKMSTTYSPHFPSARRDTAPEALVNSARASRHHWVTGHHVTGQTGPSIGVRVLAMRSVLVLTECGRVKYALGYRSRTCSSPPRPAGPWCDEMQGHGAMEYRDMVRCFVTGVTDGHDSELEPSRGQAYLDQHNKTEPSQERERNKDEHPWKNRNVDFKCHYNHYNLWLHFSNYVCLFGHMPSTYPR